MYIIYVIWEIWRVMAELVVCSQVLWLRQAAFPALKGIGDAIYKRESLNLVIIYSICLVLSYVGKSGLFVRSYLHAVCPSRRLIMCSAVSFTLLSPTMSKNIPSSVESIRVSSMNNLYPIRRRSNLLSANYTLPWLASIHHVFPRRCLQESDSLCIAIAVEQMAWHSEKFSAAENNEGWSRKSVTEVGWLSR